MREVLVCVPWKKKSKKKIRAFKFFVFKHFFHFSQFKFVLEKFQLQEATAEKIQKLKLKVDDY